MARIAVIDDVPTNRELLVTVLAALGHATIEAADGATGFELVRRERPELVICDVLMPAVDGYEFVRRLRADPGVAATPVIFSTAHYLDAEARALASACGVDEILAKPTEPEELVRVVNRILGQPPAPRRGVPPPEFDRQHLQLMTGKLSDKVAELQRANGKLEALIGLNLELASQRDPAQLLERVCGCARQLIDAAYGSVAVRETDGEALAFVRHSGIAPEVLAHMGPVALDAGALGGVYRGQTPLRLERGALRAALGGLPAAYPPLQSLLAAPVTSLTACYGWICLGNKRAEGGFTETDADLLAMLAAQAGRIYESGSLYARVQTHARTLEAEIADRERAQRQLAAQFMTARILDEAHSVAEAAPRLLRAICSELGFAAGALWSVDETGQTLRCLDVLCDGDGACAEFVARTRRLVLRKKMGVVGKVWASGEPLWLADLATAADFLRGAAAQRAGLRAGGLFPVFAGGRLAGVIEFFSRVPGAPAAQLLQTLAALGGQIGQFVDRSAQQRSIQRLTRVYAVLSGINSAIVRLHDRTTLFREACRIAVEQGGFGIAWIGEVDADSMEIVPVAWTGIDDQLGAERLSARDDAVTGQGAVGRAVRNGIPLFINDLSKIGFEGRRRAEALRRGYHALIALPLSVERRVVAVLVLYAQERDFFTGEELTLLRELANDISFALEYIGKQDQLAYLTYHDVLTGLPNRTRLHERLGQTLQAARHHPGERVAVVLWNIDRFRNINDTVGRQAGDSVLRELARRLQAAWPDPHDIARLGVDHFAGVVAGRQEITEIAHLVERVRGDLATQPVSVGEQALHLSISAGIAVFSGGEEEADTLVRNAEAALRRAKRSGVPYRFYGPEMNALVAETLMLENRLRRALERNEFTLHYQPKVNGANGRVTGLEALIRWNDPVNGLVQPATFIPILEETGMILQAGIWVIRQALSDACRWRSAGIAPPRIAVNVSAIQLQQKDFVESVRRVLDESDETLPAVDLEITESMIMTDLDENIARLGEIRGMGLDIAIDDFGTGYSSLGYLARLPVSALKIDRSFIEAMSGAPENKTIVSTIISLAHSLDLKVIAEGVEEEAQADFLRRFKCNELQGYLISRPLPPERVAAFVRAHGHAQRPH